MKLTTLLAKALDLVWWLSAVSTGVLCALLLWTLVAELPAPSSFALEISLAGFDIQPPSADRTSNLAVALPVALEAAPGARSAIKDLHGNYRFPVRRGAFLTFSVAVLVTLMSLVLWIVDQLRKVLWTLHDRDPFVEKNAARIRRIGWGVILVELVRTGAVVYWSYFAGAIVTASGAQFIPASRVSTPAILDGLVILALAEVFREGARLREEQSLTI
jgi:hypothetical protein